jgi:hypothetical protein
MCFAARPCDPRALSDVASAVPPNNTGALLVLFQAWRLCHREVMIAVWLRIHNADVDEYRRLWVLR